jgi:HEAT repeat protein
VNQFLLVSFCLAAAAAAPLGAQAPVIQNAEVSSQTLGSGLKPAIENLVRQAAEPVWIGYSVPMIPGDSTMCCFHGGGFDDGDCCKGCRLEGRQDGISRTAGPQTVRLEAGREVLVLIRAEAGRLDKLRSFSSDCPLDAGGRRVYWLNGVDAEQSVDYLAELVRASDWSGGPEKKIADSALSAMVHHAAPGADRALQGFLAAERPQRLRKQTAFWLCTARGRTGFETVRKVVRNDNDGQFRKEAMFALSVSKEGEAVDELIHHARNDASSQVREQALFWLAQKAGRKAAATLTEAIERDPETQVKKQAVFALSQLPKDEGIPLLIQVARKNNNPVVRKQAMFWLGQSNDPRALQFFEEVLTSR